MIQTGCQSGAAWHGRKSRLRRVLHRPAAALLLLGVLAAAAAGCLPDQPGSATPPQPRPETAVPTASSLPTAPSEDAARALAAALECTAPLAPGEWAEVTEVIDGDTITVRVGGRAETVRYIGINAPEMDEPAGPGALDCNRALVEGQHVYLLADVSQTDPYSRLLRYVFTGNAFVNESLVRSGCAIAAEYPPDTACSARFEAAQAAAREAGVGLWAGLQSPDGSAPAVRIADVFYNGRRGASESDEYVEIVNLGKSAVDLSGWFLKDQGSHRFVFPAFTLSAGQSCRVYTDEEHPEHCGFSFAESETAIWNNGGDCALLFTAEGSLVDQFCY